MLIIASRRSRKRSCRPEEGRVGRITKTPENRASEPDFLQFPILHTSWESLKTKSFWDFSARTKEGTSVAASCVPASPEMAARMPKAPYPNLPCRAPKGREHKSSQTGLARICQSSARTVCRDYATNRMRIQLPEPNR